MLQFHDLPRGLPGTSTTQDKAARALWLDPEALRDNPKFTADGTGLLLGELPDGTPVGIKDDRHLFSTAGSRGGKGISFILPNLTFYEGSVIATDSKGELCTLTAERRGKGRNVEAGGLGQAIFAVDPFHVADVDPEYRAGYNPFDDLDPDDDIHFVDDCDSIADALVMPGQGKNSDHFEGMAKLVLRGTTAWVATGDGPRDLTEVNRLLHLPPAPRAKKDEAPAPVDPDRYSDDLLNAMLDAPRRAYGIPFQMAATLMEIGQDEMGSVMSTVRENIKFLSSPPMARMLSGTGRKLDLKSWKFGGQTIYLCLPPMYLGTHGRFFRLILNRLLAAVASTPEKPAIPALALLDEAPVMGKMESLETASAFIAGYGLKIWSIFQDLNQVDALYGKRWQTFVGNASIFQSFALNDAMSLKYVSDRLGTSAALGTSFGDRTMEQAAQGFSGGSSTINQSPLLTPEEVAYHFSRQSGAQAIIYPGVSPIWLKRADYRSDAFAPYRDTKRFRHD